MRFMVMAIHEGDGSAAPEGAPGAGAAAVATGAAAVATGAAARRLEYRRSLQKAGVLLALDELLPPSAGARLSCKDGRPTVIDGPSGRSKETIDAYWILQVRSREEAMEWARRAPMSGNEVIEVRQVRETSDLPGDERSAAEGPERG